jgi:hypothetical protein
LIRYCLPENDICAGDTNVEYKNPNIFRDI